MSTKVYNGKKIKKELIDNINKFSFLYSDLKLLGIQQIEKYVTNKIKFNLQSIIFYFLMNEKLPVDPDYYSFGFEDINENIELDSLFFMDFIKEYNLLNKIKNECYHSLFLYEMEKEYLCYEAENNISINYLNFNFKDYIYFNNTDKPESISENEWSKRKKDWDLALDKIPLRVEIINNEDVISVFIEEIEKNKRLDLNELKIEDVSILIYSYLLGLKFKENKDFDYRKYRNDFKQGMYEKEVKEIEREYIKRLKEKDLNEMKLFKLSLKGGNICISK